MSLFVFVPVRQDIGNPRRVCQFVHFLKVFLGDFKWTCSDVGNVLSDQLAGVDGCLVDLLKKERSEGLDAGAEEGAVERHVDSLEGDGSETPFESDGLRLGLRLFHTLADDLRKVGFDIFQGHALHEGGNVDVLCFQVVEKIGKAVKSAQLVQSQQVIKLIDE